MKFVATTGRVKFLPALHSVKSTKVAHLFYNLTINILHIRLKSQQNSNNNAYFIDSENSCVLCAFIVLNFRSENEFFLANFMSACERALLYRLSALKRK